MGTKERYSGSLVFSHETGDAAGGRLPARCPGPTIASDGPHGFRRRLSAGDGHDGTGKPDHDAFHGLGYGSVHRAIVALSSTAVVMRILVDRAEIDSVWGRTCLAIQLRSDIGSLRTIMVTLFFASVGMLAKPMWFATHLHWILYTASLIFIAKALIVFVVACFFCLDR